VFVREMQSHPVSVMGAVRKPGISRFAATRPCWRFFRWRKFSRRCRGDVIILRRAGQKMSQSLFCASERLGGICAKDAVARVWRAWRNGHGSDKVGAISREVVQVNLKDLSIRPIPAQSSGLSGRHRQSFSSGNRVCRGSGAKAGRFT